MSRKIAKSAKQQSYPEFLRSLDLIWIALVKSQFSGDRDRYFQNRDRQLSVAWDSKTVQLREDFFEVRAEVTIKLSALKSKSTFFDLTTVYLLHIHAPSPLDHSHIARFTGSEVRLIIWPYVREYVSSISGRMHVPPVVLPFAGSEEG